MAYSTKTVVYIKGIIMQKILCFFALITVSLHSYANRYGGEDYYSGDVPSWILGVLLLIAVGYIVLQESKQQGDKALEKDRARKLREETWRLNHKQQSQQHHNQGK